MLRCLAALMPLMRNHTNHPTPVISMGGISGSGATVAQMVVHSTCRARQSVAESLMFQANAVAMEKVVGSRLSEQAETLNFLGVFDRSPIQVTVSSDLGFLIVISWFF